MSILYLDAVAGLAGDMLVAALVDAGLPVGYLRGELEKLGVSGWELETKRVMRGAFSALHLSFIPVAGAIEAVGEHSHSHDHEAGQVGEHSHSHDHGSDWPGQPDRRWKTIRALIQRADLVPRVRSRALRVFEVLAVAEARAHGISVEEVGFHEVGAVDSILDIVGACVGLEYLGIEEVICCPLPMGSGTAWTAHGRIPLPAPATLEVLKGFPVVASEYPGEHVTPTGAALVAALAKPGKMPPMRVMRLGYGAGTRNPSTHPNVLRVLVGEGDAGSVGEVLELRAQVDDLSGEAVPGLLGALLEAGALDAFVQPIVMKKGRPGYLVTVLCEETTRARVGDVLLRESGTAGFRWGRYDREVLARDWEAVDTPFGGVRIKLGRRGGEIVTMKPEFEDCARLAREHGVPWSVVDAAARGAWGKR